MSKKAKELAARYGRKSDIIEIAEEILAEQYRVNAFTFPRCPVITTDQEIQAFRWGLIPFWTKDGKQADEIRRMTLNARADTIFEKPSFREPIMRRRCIIPSTGYFEWRHEGKNKIPYFIYVKDEPIFSMAGIYDEWLDKATEEVVKSFSIITTDPNPLTDYIHNTKHRMPAILSAGDEDSWLDPGLGKKGIAGLLRAFPVEGMGAYVVESDFLRI